MLKVARLLPAFEVEPAEVIVEFAPKVMRLLVVSAFNKAAAELFWIWKAVVLFVVLLKVLSPVKVWEVMFTRPGFVKLADCMYSVLPEMLAPFALAPLPSI